MSRQLKKFNSGISYGKHKGMSIYIAAYSMAQAAELASRVADYTITAHYIKEYFGKCWGTIMEDIIPDKPCVYISKRHSSDKKSIKKIL